MFKLHECLDGDRRQALILPLHMCNLNQWSPFSNSQSAIKAQRLWNIFSSNLSIWIWIHKVECIMIIAFNYTRYLHIYLLYFFNAVKSSIRLLRTLYMRAAWMSDCCFSLASHSGLLSISIHCLLQSISINYHGHSKMINAFYLSLHKSMALLLPC